jgi:hypothetical protein
MKYANNIFFLKKYFTKKRAKNQKLVKTIVFKKLLTFSMIIYYLLFPTNLLIKKKLVEKMSNLSPNLQKEIEDYLLPIPSKYEKHKNRELVKVINYLQLKNYTAMTNNTLRNQTQYELFNELKSYSKKQDKNISEVKIIYLKQSLKFGNSMILLNNLIAYCEVLDIRNIYLNIEMDWPIVDDIFTENINIYFISPYQIECDDKAVLCADYEPFFYLRVVKPEIRISLFKKEVKRNLPMINTDRNDLYIHIRSGDIFKKRPNTHYAQPPLCFYQKILNQFFFKNIYIVSENKKNPLIEKLTKEYPEIIFIDNYIKTDAAILSNAYNIVGSMSSFLTTLVMINDNIKNFWDFDNYRLSEKYLHFHHDIYKLNVNYTLYEMKPTEDYRKEMFVWRNSKRQIDLMINEKCREFNVIQPNDI